MPLGIGSPLLAASDYPRLEPPVPRDDSITLADLIGKLEVLRVECPGCGRTGWYRVDQLFVTQGPDMKITNWLHNLTADCPRRNQPGPTNGCAADCPDLIFDHQDER
jgi:hypothetical protein